MNKKNELKHLDYSVAFLEISSFRVERRKSKKDVR